MNEPTADFIKKETYSYAEVQKIVNSTRARAFSQGQNKTSKEFREAKRIWGAWNKTADELDRRMRISILDLLTSGDRLAPITPIVAVTDLVKDICDCLYNSLQDYAYDVTQSDDGERE